MNLEVGLISAKEAFTSLFDKLLSTIEKEEVDDHIRENMIGDVSWSLKNYIKNKTRFCLPMGGIVYVTYQQEIVAISCMEKNDSLMKDAVLIGVRMWVRKDFRGKFLHSLYLLPEQEKWAKESGAKRVFMTFNESSRKSLYRHILDRDHSGSTYESRWDGYQSLGLVQFNYTQQYVIYKEL